VVVAWPSVSVSCRTPAGIHSALVGGSTQAASWARTVSTPLAAQASWCEVCVCQSNRLPAAIGNVTTDIAALVPSGPAHCPSCDTTWQRTRWARGRPLPSVIIMNEEHQKYCTSPEWAEHLQTRILPWFGPELEPEMAMLEIGPGPGAATDWLRHRVRSLTGLEIEADAAGALKERFAGTNVEIVSGDATALSFPDAAFDAVGTFTMLHHVPTAAQQTQVLAEALRVLRPGGVLIGSDSLASNDLHHFHEDDTYCPVDPAALLTRLQVLGYGEISLRVGWELRFVARKPSPDEDECP
jgi:SAM-dependent methyltransferase